MLDNIKDAPWIGKHKEDTKRANFVGCCICCDRPLYEDDIYSYDDELLCENCLLEQENE